MTNDNMYILDTFCRILLTNNLMNAEYVSHCVVESSSSFYCVRCGCGVIRIVSVKRIVHVPTLDEAQETQENHNVTFGHLHNSKVQCNPILIEFKCITDTL